LDAEAHELDPFHDVEFGRPEIGVVAVGAVGEDDGGDVQADGVDYYHPEDVSEGALVTDDEVEARVEHECLARYHAYPSCSC